MSIGTKVDPRLAASARLAERGKLEDAVAMLGDVLRERPDDGDALMALGAITLARGDRPRALAIFSHLAAIDPKNAHVLANLAQCHRLGGDAKAAATCLRRAVDIDPDDTGHRLKLAEVNLELGAAQECCAQADAVLRQNPSDADALLLRGLAQLTLGEAAAARNAFISAASADPEMAAARVNLARLALIDGEFAAALVDAERAFMLEPDDPDVKLCYGAALLATGRIDRALEQARAVLALAPDHAEARRIEVHARLQQQPLDSILADLAAAVRLRPAAREPLMLLAGVLRHAGRVEEALTAIQEVLRIMPGDGEAHVFSNECRLALGDFSGLAEPIEGVSGPSFERHFASILVAPRAKAPEVLLAARFFQNFAVEGETIDVHASPDLAALLVGVAGIRLRPLDAKAAAPSLAAANVLVAARPDRRDLAAMTPYLRAEAGRLRQWQAALAEHRRPAIGIIWHSHVLPLEEIVAELAPTMTLVSLAVGQARAELENHSDILDAGRHVDDPRDFVAAVASLDAVLVVDSLAAHVAGALGTPGCVVVGADAPWFWAAERGQSIWYPSLAVCRLPFRPSKGAGTAAACEALRQRVSQTLSAMQR